MKTEKKDLKWLSDLSESLVLGLEEEEKRHADMLERTKATMRRIEAKGRSMHARMRATALQIATKASKKK